MKVAAVQMEPKILEKERNIARCLKLMRTTAKEGAQLIIFPECALSGYCFASLAEAIPVAEPVPGPSSDKIASLCRELNAYVIVGLLEKDKNRYYNAAAFIGPQGLVGKYRKIHLPHLGIDRFVTAGDLPFTVYETGLGRIGMAICYDANFPESCRTLALQGADLIALPTNWPQGAESVPEVVIPTRALENHVFCIAANRVGKERGFSFFGRSKICHWVGITLEEGKMGEEDILYADIELADAREKRLVLEPGEFEVDFISHRRPDFYGRLAQP